MRVKWLHISDIHFNYRNYDSELLRKDFIRRMAELGKHERFTQLILSGDILFQNKEYDSGTTQFLESLVSALSISKERVFIVPGNHDHDRDATRVLAETLFSEKQEAEMLAATENLDEAHVAPYLETFKQFNSCVSSFLSRNYYTDYSSPHFLSSENGLNVIHLNTAWLDTASGDPGKLLIGTFQLQNLLVNKESILKTENALNIAVGHHPLEELNEEERKRVLDLFSRFNIGLYLCGHMHQPSVKYYHEKDILQIVCPGGYKDGYSEGGYVWGILDTDSDFYMAEFFNWNAGSWSIESKLDGTDERGRYYFQTNRFCHRSNIVAYDLKLYDGHIQKAQLDASIGDSAYKAVCIDLPIDSVWSEQEKPIVDLAKNINATVAQGGVVHLYPLAPIPTLIKLGFELQNNTRLFIHQYDRDAERWVRDSEKDEIRVLVSERRDGNDELIVKIASSFNISDKSVNGTLPLDNYDYVEIRTEPNKLGFPLFLSGIKEVANVTIDYLNAHISQYDKIHIFAAIPAGLAVELGRRMLDSIYNNIYLYNYRRGEYELAFVLNPLPSSPSTDDSGKASLNNVVPFVSNGEITYLPILGNIACGDISEAIAQSGEVFPVSKSILSTGDYFILRASGDSMINAGIDDGDLILIRQQNTADDGEIVVARVEDDTTLKRIYHDKDRKLIVLRSENDSYSDQEFSEVEVQGVATMVFKQL